MKTYVVSTDFSKREIQARNKKEAKGEWRVSLSNTSYADVVVNGFDICTCWSGYVGEDETKDNAKLIAAAPELIEALEKIKSMCDGNKDNENNIWHIANKAINKATK